MGTALRTCPRRGSDRRAGDDWDGKRCRTHQRRLGTAYVASEKVTLSRASLLETFCARAWNEGARALSPPERSGLLTVARAVLAKRRSEGDAQAQVPDDSSDDEDGSSSGDDSSEGGASAGASREEEEEVEAEEAQPELPDEALLNQVLADPSSFFPRMQISALYASNRPEHCCIPTHVESLTDPKAPAPGATRVGQRPSAEADMGVRMKLAPSPLAALANGAATSKVTVCLVDSTLEVAERGFELRPIGRGACSCARCIFERAHDGHDGGGGQTYGNGAVQVSNQDLRCCWRRRSTAVTTWIACGSSTRCSAVAPQIATPCAHERVSWGGQGAGLKATTRPLRAGGCGPNGSRLCSAAMRAAGHAQLRWMVLRGRGYCGSSRAIFGDGGTPELARSGWTWRPSLRRPGLARGI